jgi:hypothetical protein
MYSVNVLGNVILSIPFSSEGDADQQLLLQYTAFTILDKEFCPLRVHTAMVKDFTKPGQGYLTKSHTKNL